MDESRNVTRWLIVCGVQSWREGLLSAGECMSVERSSLGRTSLEILLKKYTTWRHDDMTTWRHDDNSSSSCPSSRMTNDRTRNGMTVSILMGLGGLRDVRTLRDQLSFLRPLHLNTNTWTTKPKKTVAAEQFQRTRQTQENSQIFIFSICLSVCLPVGLSVLSVSAFVCLCLSVCLYLSIYVFVCLFVCSVCLCLSLSLFVCLSVCLSAHLSICLSLWLAVCLSLNLSVYIFCLSVCLYVCVYLPIHLFFHPSNGSFCALTLFYLRLGHHSIIVFLLSPLFFAAASFLIQKISQK